MSVEKKTIRSDIPGSHVFLNGGIGYIGSTADGGVRRLVVTRDITLNGDIASCNYLVIEGVVKAETFSARRMDILDGGLFTGNAEVQDCIIAGRFEGKLLVHGRLTVKPTGLICGEVEYGVLEVEAGGKIRGQVISNAVTETAEAAAVPALTVLPPNVEPLFSSDEDDSGATGRATAYRRAARV
jgi:cytoskeletal protein CcmA (bactofilin family)